jgi:hypothetical protein
MCPHTARYVSSYCYRCVLILLYMCPHTAIYVSSYCYICVLILLYLCPHTAIYVSSYCYICVLILLDMCPHTAIYVSSYFYVCVITLLYMCPHTAIYVSSYCYICVLILLYIGAGWATKRLWDSNRLRAKLRQSAGRRHTKGAMGQHNGILRKDQEPQKDVVERRCQLAEPYGGRPHTPVA